MSSAITKAGVSTCCNCWSLRTGSIIIGAIHLICGIFFLITTSLVIPLTSYAPNDIYGTKSWYAKSCIIGTLSYIVVWVGAATLLIIGGVHRNASYVFPSVCLGFGNLVAQFAIFIGFLFTLFHYDVMSGALIITLWAVFAILLPLQLYMWLVIVSFFKELIAAHYGYADIDSTKVNYQRSTVDSITHY